MYQFKLKNKLILFIFILIIVLNQCIYSQLDVVPKADADSIKFYSINNEVPFNLVLYKNLDSLFYANIRMFNNVIVDSTLTINKGLVLGENGATIKNIKMGSDYKTLDVTLADGSQFYLTRKGNPYFINYNTGIDSPQYFATTQGVKTASYAAYLIQKDTFSIKLLSDGEFEDSASVAANWTFTVAGGGSGTWKMPLTVMSGYIDPTTTKSLLLVAAENKAVTFDQYIHLDSGKIYYIEALTKLVGAPAISQITIIDSIETSRKVVQETISNTSWDKFLGNPEDTISTYFQSIVSTGDQGFEKTNHWTSSGNHSFALDSSESISQIYDGEYVGRIISSGTGDATSNNVYLLAADVGIETGKNYNFQFHTYSETTPNSTDSIIVSIGDIRLAYHISKKEIWETFTGSFISTATTDAANLKIYLNQADTIYFDELSVLWDGGDRTFKVTIKETGVAGDSLWVDNFLIREKTITPWGKFLPGDAFIFTGEFPDSFQLDGKYIQGDSLNPILLIAKDSAKFMGNWITDTPIMTTNVVGVTVSGFYIEKILGKGMRLSMVPPTQDGWFTATKNRLDSIGTGVGWIIGDSINTLSGNGLAIQLRGNHHTATDNYITRTWNDAFNCTGSDSYYANNYCDDIAWSPIGDGIQLTAADRVIIKNNFFRSHRALYDSTFDHKAALNINGEITDPIGRDMEMAYNTLMGFSGAVGGKGQFVRIHHNFVSDCKISEHTSPYTGGNAIATMGDSGYIYMNIITNSVNALFIKRAGDQWISNNTCVDFNSYSSGINGSCIESKSSWAAYQNDSVSVWNNIFYTDSLNSKIISVTNTMPIKLWDYNVYYSPENEFVFKTATTFEEIQTLGFDLNSFNESVLFDASFRPVKSYTGIEGHIDVGKTLDYLNNPAVLSGIWQCGAIRKQ